MSDESCQCGQAHGACNTEFQYAVKTVCGEVFASQDFTPVAPGRYWTAVNIHNPTKCEQATFRWKVAVANPGKPGVVTSYSRPVRLNPDEAIEIDCQQVMQRFPLPPPNFVKGYVVIESDVELDVVAVYSGTTGACGSNSFHTERVKPRTVPVCEDLVLPLNTGFADWQTISPAGPVSLVNPASLWAPAPFGSSWVSQAFNDSQSASLSTRNYQLCFDLCFGYTFPASFPIQVLADNTANVLLNGNLLGSVSSFSTPTTLTFLTQFLRAGRNCLQVNVTNLGQSNNPTGFALNGLLRVVRGKCPCSPLPIVKVQGPAGSFEASAVETLDTAEASEVVEKEPEADESA